MAGHASRAGLVAVAWTASALLAGYLLAPRFAPAPVEGLGPAGTGEDASRRPAPAVAGPPPLAGDIPQPEGASLTAAVHRDAASGLSDTAASVPSEPGVPPPPAGIAGPPGRLRVQVVHADGAPATGATVYALPAGAPGADDGDGLYSADCDDEGRAELPVPGGAPLDVGAVGAGARAMQRDVQVAAGGTIDVRLSLGRGRPISFTIEFGTPVPPQWQNQLQVRLHDDGPGEGVHRWYPGRDEHQSVGTLVARFGAEARAALGPVVEGNRYRVDVRQLQHVASQVAGVPNAEYWPEPAVARAGDTVAIRVRRQAELALRVSVDPALQSGVFGCTVWLVDGAGNRFASILNTSVAQILGRAPPDPALVIPRGLTPEQEAAVRQAWERQRAAQRPIEWPLVVPAPGATARLAWQGAGIRPGESEPLRFVPGQRLEFEIRLEPATVADVNGAGGEAGGRRLLLTGPRPPEEDGASYFVYLLRGDEPQAESLDFTPDEPTIHPDPSRAPPRSPAIAVASGLLASEPFEFPETGDIAVELRPAGLLLVVDTGATANPPGPLVELERADGAPIPWSNELNELDFDGWQRGLSKSWTAWEAYRRVHGRLGAVIGPLPAGPVEFEVRRGGFPAGRLSATVVAGQIRPLVIGP